MIYFHSHATSCFFFVSNKIVNTKEAISTYDKYYIKDDGVAELGQLHFCSLHNSFSIQTFWNHSLQIIVNSAMASHSTVILLNILFCTMSLYCMPYILYYITSQSV